MRRINRPIDTAQDTFTTCISRIRDQEFKQRLEAILDVIVQADVDYQLAGLNGNLHTIPPLNNINGTVTNAEMVSVYTGRLAKNNSAGRPIYDRLFSSAKNNECPFCGQRHVSSLDHHLNKSSYTSLTVVPFNLVPCCSDCNKIKSNSAPTRPEDVLLHPYFDDVENDRWLYARVIPSNPATIEFYVQPDATWSKILSDRVINHFSRLKLDSLYRSNAAQEILSIRLSLERILTSVGVDGVNEHLLDAYQSRAAIHINSWQTAAYDAFANSRWFCEGGFR